MSKCVLFYPIVIICLTGCGIISNAVSNLDSSWDEDKRVYRQADPLPPLEIPPSLAANRTAATPALTVDSRQDNNSSE